MARVDEDDERPQTFAVAMDSKEIPCNRTGEGPVRLIFTHGAGGTITSDGIANFAAGFSTVARSSIICFQGSMNLKSRVKMFDAVQDNAVSTYKCQLPLALGGRSMGARAAVMAATEDTKCLLLASYPLQTDKEVRDQILLDLSDSKEVLFISGDHDSMCDLNRLNEVRGKMKAKSWLIRARDADHGMNMKPKKATRAISEECGRLAEEWLHARQQTKTEREVFWTEDDQGEGCVHSGTWGKAAEAESRSRDEGAKMGEETKKKSPKTKRTEHIEETAKPHKETEAIPSRTKKASSDAKGSKPKHEAVSVSGTEARLRRSKRRKVGL